MVYPIKNSGQKYIILNLYTKGRSKFYLHETDSRYKYKILRDV